MQNGQELIKKIDTLNETAWECFANESERALSLSQEAYQLSTTGIYENVHHKKGVVYSLPTMAITKHLVHGDYRSGIEKGLQAVNLAEELKNDVALNRAYYILHIIHSEIGNFLKSIEYLILRLNLCEKRNDTSEIASTKMALGSLYADLGQYDHSLAILSECLLLYTETENEKGVIAVLNNLSFVYMCLENYKQSIQTILTALNNPIIENLPPTRNLLLSKLGASYLAIDQLDKAEMYLNQAIQEAKSQPDKYLHIRAHQRFGKLQMKRQYWSSALEHLQKALTLSIEIGHRKFQFECHELLGICLKEQGQFAAALAQYEAFYQVKESVFNERTQQQIQALEIEHRTETAVNEAKIYRLKTISLEEMVEKRTQALADQSFQLQQLLEREQHLAHELQLALEREAALSQIRARIIEVVSHEFRTPLTVINTTADLLKRRYNQLGEEKKATYFKRIKDSVFNLSDLLNDVTFISEADKSQLTPTYQTLPFQNLCQLIEQHVLPSVENRPNIFFSYPYDAVLVSTDPKLIQQIIINLLSNAIQYSSSTSPIHINLTMTMKSLYLSVEDQGIGIPKEERKSIFQLFQRGSNVGTRRGLGLGLSIVKRISDSLGGQISVHSNEPKQGTIIKVRIPNQYQP